MSGLFSPLGLLFVMQYNIINIQIIEHITIINVKPCISGGLILGSVTSPFMTALDVEAAFYPIMIKFCS